MNDLSVGMLAGLNLSIFIELYSFVKSYTNRILNLGL